MIIQWIERPTDTICECGPYNGQFVIERIKDSNRVILNWSNNPLSLDSFQTICEPDSYDKAQDIVRSIIRTVGKITKEIYL